MLIGNKAINTKELRRACRTPEALLEYTLALIPEQVSHVRAIVDNQKYYVATLVRNFKSMPYAQRKRLCDTLLRGVRVCGVCNELYDYGDLIASVDVTLWERLKERDDATR